MAKSNQLRAGDNLYGYRAIMINYIKEEQSTCKYFFGNYYNIQILVRRHNSKLESVFALFLNICSHLIHFLNVTEKSHRSGKHCFQVIPQKAINNYKLNRRQLVDNTSWCGRIFLNSLTGMSSAWTSLAKDYSF
jgi:hypothetical protein